MKKIEDQKRYTYSSLKMEHISVKKLKTEQHMSVMKKIKNDTNMRHRRPLFLKKDAICVI